MRPLALALAVALAGAAGPAGAGPRVTLNGVAIDGVTSQRFENATVVVDERGDVHIEAKGYAVRTVELPAGAVGAAGLPAARPEAAPDQPAGPGRLSRRYFLVTEHAAPGTQFDLAVFVNARWIREVKASEPQVVMEITRYLSPGANRIVLATTKRLDEDRASTSKDVALRMLVAEGKVGADRVTIDSPLLDATRTAAEVQDRTDEFTLEAR